MSELERCELMEALKSLPEEKKQFVLGYAAGVAAKTEPKDAEPKEAGDGK